MDRIYSKPTLLGDDQENTSYRSEFSFSISATNEMVVPAISVTIETALTSPYIKRLIQEGKARVALRIKSNLRSYFLSLEKPLGKNTIELSKDDLASIDKIYIQGYILANEDFVMSDNNELIDCYDKDFAFNFTKNDILALSNEKYLYYSNHSISFISLVKSEKEEKDLHFSASNSNCIQIRSSEDFIQAYDILKKRPEAKDLVNSALAFDSILYTLLKMAIDKDRINDYKSRSWYTALEKCLDDERYHDLEDFIKNVNGTEELDIDEIYRVAQELINNRLKMAIVEASKREGPHE
jgi:hypothetical protein